MATHTEGMFASELKAHLMRFDDYVHRHILYAHSEPDHICYKCGSREEFEAIRNSCERDGAPFWNSQVSGRSIAYIRLSPGIKTTLGVINYLELQDQKPDGSQKPCFAHIEAYPSGWGFEELLEYIGPHGKVAENADPRHPTADFKIYGHFIFRCAREPLIEKIIREEMRKNAPAA